MDEKSLFLKTAQAIRTLVAENKELKSDAALQEECLKFAFDMAASGDIDDSSEAIMSKARELAKDKDEFAIEKKAAKRNSNRYEAIGSINEKTASYGADEDSSVGPAELAFLARMQENY